MSKANTPTSRAGYFLDDRLEIGLRYAYRPEYVPLLLTYLGAESGTSVLEVGCGTGFLSRLLKQALPDTHVVGMDTDAKMLDTARKLASQDGLQGQIDWHQGDAFQLPFPDNHFDLVTSHRLL